MNINDKNDTNDANTCQNNICFFLDEPPIEELDDNNIFLDQLMQEFEEVEVEDDHLESLDSALSEIKKEKEKEQNDFYINDREFVVITVRELMKICQYYEISKNIKASKCKKEDIISTIIYFESCAENYDIVQRRRKMWSYMTELSNDSKMRAYIYWE